jgi:hypothetical protein
MRGHNYSLRGRQGDLVTLTFRPNPNFEPPSLEARVFHGMQGEMTVDTKQERLAAPWTRTYSMRSADRQRRKATAALSIPPSTD